MMLVRDTMTKDPVACAATAPLREAVALMKKHHIGGLPVMEGEKLVGIITESDIIAQPSAHAVANHGAAE